MPSKKQKLLTPSQMKCKKPRVVNYKDDLEKQQKARDIIILYVDCGLGYSPIRHVVGCKNDKLVEDVVRQHMLGRNNVDEENGELMCPQSRYLSEYQKGIIAAKADRYLTSDDPYVVSMLANGTWSDDPAYGPKFCHVCGTIIEDDWIYCPKCASKL